jgi:hypothetical protein
LADTIDGSEAQVAIDVHDAERIPAALEFAFGRGFREGGRQFSQVPVAGGRLTIGPLIRGKHQVRLRHGTDSQTEERKQKQPLQLHNDKFSIPGHFAKMRILYYTTIFAHFLKVSNWLYSY